MQQLVAHVMGDIAVVADAGDDNRRRGGEQQGRDLRHQAVADGHQHILLEGGVGAQVVLKIPIQTPPIRLIARIIIPAMASPRTNFDAPSIAP